VSRFRRVAGYLVAVAAIAQSSKRYRNQAEFQIYDAVIKDLTTGNFSRALADLDTWKKGYPESDYKDDRQFLYVQVYAAVDEPANAVTAAGDLLSRQDLEAAVGGPVNVVKLLYTVATAIVQLPTPAAEQMTLAATAARQLLAYDKKPDGVAVAAWQQARRDLETAARGALIHLALVPATEALRKNDCAAAESGFTKALEEFPDSIQAAWYLGTADLCLYKTEPGRAVPALYAIARAAVVDPAKGGVDPKWQQQTVAPYLERLFEQYHGKDPEGLSRLKDLAARAPLPPPDFTIQSVAQRARDEADQSAKNNPQLALWIKIKAALSDTNGVEYFVSSLQGAQVPQLRGVLMEAKPSCRPKQLLVAVPAPDASEPLQPEITLKLDKPLAGSPGLNQEFHWEGLPTAFTKSPFMLTMDAEVAKIEGLAVRPCTERPASGAVTKKNR
jgi:hypothetical protein